MSELSGGFDPRSLADDDDEDIPDRLSSLPMPPSIDVERPRGHARSETVFRSAGRSRDALRKIRDEGATVVSALHALVKLAVDRAADAPVVAAADKARAALAELWVAGVGDVALAFIRGEVHFCGQILHAPRAVYERAVELGVWLGDEGLAELRVAPDVEVATLITFARALAAPARDPMRRGAVARGSFAGIKLLASNPAIERPEPADDAPVRDRFLRVYAGALLVMHRFYESVARGEPTAPHRVKRLAQELVTLVAAGDPMMLGLITFAGAYGDDAGRAVQAALLAVAATREISSDALTLARVALAALMADVGRARLLGADRDRKMSRDDRAAIEAAVAPASTAVCLAVGGLNLTNALRTVIVYETTWREREGTIGPLYQQQLEPLLRSEILRVVRAFIDRVAPRAGAVAPPMSPLDALADLAQKKWLAPMVFRLLVRALGVIPTGTVVELETGEWAVVLCPSADPRVIDRPRVRLVTDASGRALKVLRDIDLGSPPEGQWVPGIGRVVGPAEAQFNVARVFLTP